MDSLNSMKVVGYVQPLMHYLPEQQHLVPFGFELLARGKISSRVVMPDSMAQLYDWAEIDHAVLKFINRCRCPLCMLEGNRRKLFVNLSPRTLMHPKIYHQWYALLEQVVARFPNRIVLEIHEMTDPNLLMPVLDDFKSLGLKVALDDFGCGYDQALQLISADWDYCKLDLSAYDGKGEEAILKDIQTCQGMGIEVILEKVETFAQLPHFAALGVKYFQGFAFGQPTVPKDVYDPILSEALMVEECLADLQAEFEL